MKKWCLFLSGYMMLCLLASCGGVETPPAASPADPAVSVQEEEQGPAPLTELYMQVLEDLWVTDSALNADISIIGMDLTGTSLSEEDRTALAEAFAENHGVALVEGTWKELCDAGYIDVENLYWADGCHFSITETEEGTFDAQKWRSGLGAYFFTDCTAEQSEAGEWSYTVGAHAIS